MQNPNLTTTSAQFAKSDINFNLWCILNGKKPTKRQASKYRNNPENDFSNDFALIAMDCESSDGLNRFTAQPTNVLTWSIKDVNKIS